MMWHTTLTSVGLYATPEAPTQFKEWVEALIHDWDFDNICTAHVGNTVGGAKTALKATLQRSLPTLEGLVAKNRKLKASS